MKKRHWLISAAITLLAACTSPTDKEPPQGGYADAVFVGDHIVTIDPATDGATGIAIRGDKIVFVGTREEALTFADSSTRVEELGERALIPGLIDAHGHFMFTARLLKFVNLSSPPVGTARSVDDIVELLKQFIEDNEVPPGTWVMGYGYDDSLLAEQRHPTRDDLDRVSVEHPIGIMHVSAHFAAANSPGLAAVKISADSDDPPGGIIRRRAGTDEPDGVLEEVAAYAVIALLARGDSAELETQVRDAARYYASYGVTTAQDGSANASDIEALRGFAAAAPLPIDLTAFSAVNRSPAEAIEQLRPDSAYVGGFRVAGAKLSLDGSPQGRTAWLTQPYTEGPAGAAPDYVAYPTLDPQVYKSAVATLLRNGVPVLAHANGDAAIDLMLDGVEDAVTADGIADHRAVIIHAQLMRADQLDRAKSLGTVPSFFSAHPFFWGDWHRKSFGDERALNISPIRWAIDRDVPFTIHNDAPVVPPDMMRLLWATVNRETRSGFVLGEAQRASTYEALYAMTQGATWQYFEEDSKGSISSGKQADLVILDRNPLDAAPDTLKDIAVLETIARGQSVFKASPHKPIDLANCTAMTGTEIFDAFADTVDNTVLHDMAGGRAFNQWFADGRFTTDWSGENMSGTVSGTWRVKDDLRCATVETGLEGAIGQEICSPLYRCDKGLISINADGSIHGVHHPRPH